MALTKSARATQLIQLWDKIQTLPGGRWLMSKALGVMIPYSGGLNAQIEALGNGFARVRLKDRRKVRNHLRSIHAMALANLGELSTGLALHSALPSNARAILTRFEIEYLKKARGEIVAECNAPRVEAAQSSNVQVTSILQNTDKEPVARVVAVWRVGPSE